jgi:hypothetical protein
MKYPEKYLLNKYGYSLDGEYFIGDEACREDAIIAAETEINDGEDLAGQTYSTGQCLDPRAYINAKWHADIIEENIIENLHDHISDELLRGCEFTQEQRDSLKEAIQNWIDTKLSFKFHGITNIQKHNINNSPQNAN